jgi:hypothetical protein
MARTAEQAAADDALAEAIRVQAVAYDNVESGHQLITFAVIGYWEDFDDPDRSRYTTGYSDGRVPHHVALGLFRVGQGRIAAEDQ